MQILRTAVFVALLLSICGIVSPHETDDHYFLVVSPKNIFKLSKTKDMLITGLTNAVACDYDFQRGYLFFSDVDEHNIKRANLNGTDVQVVVNANIFHPDGIAVDWISKVIYWTDYKLDVIDAADYDGNHRIRLIDTGLDAPRAIVVSPIDGYVWWTDWGTSPKIERAWMDGTHREAIVTTSLGWPNGLTVDYATKLIFWADAKLSRIERSHYDGSHRRALAESVPHPFALSTYGDYIFWTDWKLQWVETAHKTDGSGRKRIAKDFGRPSDIHFVSQYRQTGINACTQNNGGCPSLCLARPNNLRPVCQPEKFEANAAITSAQLPNVNTEDITTPERLQMDEGSRKSIQCKTTYPITGATDVELIWSGKNLGQIDKISTQTDNGVFHTSTLTMTASPDINQAEYICDAKYNGFVLFSHKTQVEIYYAPEAINWYETPATLKGVEGKELTLMCEVGESFPGVTTRFWRSLNGVNTTFDPEYSIEIAGERGGTVVRIAHTFLPSREASGAVFWCEATFNYLSGEQVVRRSTKRRLLVFSIKDSPADVVSAFGIERQPDKSTEWKVQTYIIALTGFLVILGIVLYCMVWLAYNHRRKDGERRLQASTVQPSTSELVLENHTYVPEPVTKTVNGYLTPVSYTKPRLYQKPQSISIESDEAQYAEIDHCHF